MGWSVSLSKRVTKNLIRLPKNTREALEAMVVDLKEGGPARGDWPNYSKLADGSHYCHLNYRYVAVWLVENQVLKIIEVIYVGSRENAPY